MWKTAVYFSDAGADVVASQAQVRAGAPDLPYALKQAGVIAKTGNSTYAGCTAYRETAISDVWTRPDGTAYAEAKGPGTPEGPVDVCVTTTIKSAQVNLSNWCSLGHVPTWGVNYHTINKNEKKNTETGVSVSTTCVEASVSSSTTGTVVYDENAYQACDSYTIPASSRISWNPWGGTRYASQSSPWPGYTAVYGTGCPSGF